MDVISGLGWMLADCDRGGQIDIPRQRAALTAALARIGRYHAAFTFGRSRSLTAISGIPSSGENSVSDYRELLIGAGRSRVKRVGPVPGEAYRIADWHDLTTLDSNPDCECDITWDLERWPLPFDDDTFAEIHAYEVLEHLGAQGSVHAFFGLFFELWRILRPDGYLCATTPSRFSAWAWGDPGHTRIISPESLIFLDQTEYTKQCDALIPTPMSDYRTLWHGDFSIVSTTDSRATHSFILQAIKPTRKTKA